VTHGEELLLTELRIIGDNLGAVRDVLALISRQAEAPDTRTSDAILRLLQVDPHQFSTRPCQTCRAVSALAGKPFGCELPRKP
jgi:hypothetical protein